MKHAYNRAENAKFGDAAAEHEARVCPHHDWLAR